MNQTLRNPVIAFALVGALVACCDGTENAHAEDENAASPSVLPDDAAYPGMVLLPAVGEQPIGMDEKRIMKFLESIEAKVLEDKKRFDYVWDNAYALMGPAHDVRVGAVWMGQYEVTNAQWARYMDEPFNTHYRNIEAEGESLGSIVKNTYGIDPIQNGPAYLRTWMYLLGRNEEVLLPTFNGEGAADWDPRMAKADELPIPPGTRLALPKLTPPEYWRTDDTFGEIPDHELRRPIRFVNYYDAKKFCRWAGFHLPRETEWERAARGPEGRLFAWGDEWSPLLAVHEGFNRAAKAEHDAYKQALRDGVEGAVEPTIVGIDWFGDMMRRDTPRPAEVDAFADGATPEGLHHMTGNVAEWVFDRTRKYPESKSGFKFDNYACQARGGAYDQHDSSMLASNRQWDAGRQIEPHVETNNIGFRLAAYPVPGMDLTMEIAEFFDDGHAKSPAYWMPKPPGLSKKAKTSDYKLFNGYVAERTAGQINRDLDAGAKNHVYVKGAAIGAALLPIKGIPDLKNAKSVKDYAEDPEQILAIGIFAGTDNCSLKLVDAAGKELPPLSMALPSEGALQFWGQDPRFGTFVHTGALFVLEKAPPPPPPAEGEETPEPVKGLRVAVYPTNNFKSDGNGRYGNHGSHVRAENRLGYLPDVVEYEMVDMDEAQPEGAIDAGIATLTIVLPSLDKKKGTIRKAKGVKITVRVPVAFR